MANRWILITLALVFSSVSLILGALSDGVHHDDDLTHFLFARWAWTFPGYLFHLWGRPGYTAPTALVAWIGDRQTAWHMARALSAFVTLIGAVLAADVGRQIGLRYWAWIVCLCYVQPLNFLLSFTTLTENFTALYLVAAIWCLQRRRIAWGSALFSLALVSRVETVVLLPVWGYCVIAMARRAAIPRTRVFLAAITSLWAPIAQNIGHFACFGTFPVSAYLRPSGSTEYLATGPLAFLPQVLLAASPVVLLLAILGAGRVHRRGATSVVALAFVFLATHWLIKWIGLFASGGFARFVVAVAPLLAIAAAGGLETAMSALRRHGGDTVRVAVMAFGLLIVGYYATLLETRAGRLAFDIHRLDVLSSPRVITSLVGIVALTLILGRMRPWTLGARLGLLSLFVVSFGLLAHFIRPLRLTGVQSVARDVAIDARILAAGKPVFAANPWIAWWSGFIEDPTAHKGRRLLSSMPDGTIFVWDPIYSPSDFHKLVLDDFEKDPAYQRIREIAIPDDGVFVLLKKVGETPIEG
ncbi:MAG: hypothetical protein KDA33_08030, partial [Phycisphaerales bacterium]|nr:hypothetical protein [Phycisphaerales bacterium]